MEINLTGTINQEVLIKALAEELKPFLKEQVDNHFKVNPTPSTPKKFNQNSILTIGLITSSIIEWSDSHKVPIGVIINRKNNGWTDKQAVCTKKGCTRIEDNEH